MMIPYRLRVSFFIFLLQLSAFASFPTANASSNLTHILQDVLKAMTAELKWDLNDVRVLNFDIGKVKYGTTRSCEFQIGLGENNNMSIKISDGVGSWNKFTEPESDLGSLIKRVSSLGVLDSVKLEGPFELRVDELHRLSLSLPMNVSYTGLKHILVGEGIIVEVKRAQEVSIFPSSDLNLQMNGSVVFSKGRSDSWPFLQSMCIPLTPIRVFGSASLVAYRSRNPFASLGTTIISEDTVELLSDKCYHGHINRTGACPVDSLSLRLTKLEKVLRSLLGRKILQAQSFGFLKANIKASAAVKFPLKLERDIGTNTTLDRKLPDWRTRPSVERVWYEIFARVEEDRLKPVTLNKKMKPEADSVSWASFTSNMSYTKLRPVLVPPQALTLDVKW